MTLSLAEAKITDQDGEIIQARCQITARADLVTIRTTAGNTTRGGITSIEQISAGRWTIQFEDGTSWTVARITRGCGCGR